MSHRPVNRMPPVHPGEILREDFLVPLGMNVNALSLAIGVPATRMHEIIKQRRAVSADTAARLARYFGGDAGSWLALQAAYDLENPAHARGQRGGSDTQTALCLKELITPGFAEGD